MRTADLSDSDTRSYYLGLIRTGSMRFAAASGAGLTARAVQLYAANHPEFADELAEAEAEAAEPIEVAVYEAAVAGDEWAVKLWLAHRQKERWSVKAEQTTNIVIVGADDLAQLQAKLESRQRELSSGTVIDTQSEEA